MARRELWLSPITAYELLEGLLNASPHTCPISLAAIEEAAAIPRERVLAYGKWRGGAVHRWLVAAGNGALEAAGHDALEAAGRLDDLPQDFRELRRRLGAGRQKFLGQIRRFMAAVMPNWRSAGDPLFSPEWRAVAGHRKAAETLDADFVFQTAVLERAMRIRYNPDRHPSDYLDCLQLRFLKDEDLAFITADRKLARMTWRSLQSDRIVVWDELF